MKSVPRSRFEFIKKVHPAADMALRDGVECVIIPTYNPETDATGEIVMRIVDDPPDRKPEPGDILRDKFGNVFEIKDPSFLIPVRKGPKAEWSE